VRGHSYDAFGRPLPVATVAAGHDDGDVPAQRGRRSTSMAARSSGTFKGQPVTIQDVYEAVGKHSVGAMNDARSFETLEQNACPSAGACGAHSPPTPWRRSPKAIGLALPYSAGAPAPYEIRDKFCRAGRRDDRRAHHKNIRPRDIVTRKALENAAAVVAATGGFDQMPRWHLPAIANECGVKFDLFDVAEVP